MCFDWKTKQNEMKWNGMERRNKQADKRIDEQIDKWRVG